MADFTNSGERPFRQGFVYFIGGKRGPVKIGWAFNPAKRVTELQTASPIRLSVIAAIPGTQRDERALHERHADGRLEGEWFTRTQEILGDIADAIAMQPPIPAKPSRRRPRKPQNVQSANLAFDAVADFMSRAVRAPFPLAARARLIVETD